METFSFSMLQCICGYFNSDLVFPGMRQSPERIVEEYEMEIYAEDGGITYLGEQAIPIHSGMVLFAMPGTKRHSILPVKNYYLKLPVQNSPMTELMRSMPVWYDSANVDLYMTCINRILAGILRKDDWLKCAGIFRLFSYLQEEKKQIDSAGITSLKEIGMVNAAVQFMKENLARKCTLEEIASAVHLSPFYFHSIFRKVRNETPQNCLTGLRLEKASELLLTTDMDIRSIAEVCGFSSQSYFTDVFRRHTELTPRMYRLRMMEKYIR
ncbi:MAG: helix-turn-helix transcriptional regulator [Clostridia bacterium]|nr:helix-turn-helix transcriptional regulator [Clostridia bacterium]